MISMTTQLQKIAQILTPLHDNVFHYHADEQSDRYIVWAEENENDNLSGDNVKKHQAINGYIDLYTKEEFDTLIDDIQNTLNENQISFYLNTVQYEEETNYIHYEWIFEIG